MKFRIYTFGVILVNVSAIGVFLLFAWIHSKGNSIILGIFLGLFAGFGVIHTDIGYIRDYRKRKSMMTAINSIRETNARISGVVIAINKLGIYQYGYNDFEGVQIVWLDKYTVDVNGVLYNTLLYEEKDIPHYNRNKSIKVHYDIGETISGYLDFNRLLDGKEVFLILDNDKLHKDFYLEPFNTVSKTEVIQ